MFAGKKCVAMILAGGQGNRLGVLTKYRAKPAVPFGGKYRIIDFTLSNCSNSGIDTVGVLTQYQPLELNSYIGTGAPWDLDGIGGGAFVLPPYVSGKAKGRWYTGTANAIYQNMYFIDRYSPEYLLVLSGDHIYKMDYNEMLRFHKEKGADVTIGALKVPMSDAHRFGIMDTDENLRITEFQEKPEKPKNDLASMGIYVFSWENVRRYLKADAQNQSSTNDFGKDILPAMLASGEKMYAYPFSGYWKDVGTVESLWEANMELLQPSPPIRLRDPDWKIYARDPNMPPHYTSDTAETVNCMIAQGCHVYGRAVNSILFPGVTLMEGAEVYDSIIMPGTYIGEGAAVKRTITDENVYIGAGAQVGGDTDITVIGSDTHVCCRACVLCGQKTEPKSRIDAGKEE